MSDDMGIAIFCRYISQERPSMMSMTNLNQSSYGKPKGKITFMGHIPHLMGANNSFLKVGGLIFEKQSHDEKVELSSFYYFTCEIPETGESVISRSMGKK
jgi:hypothetical protein